MKQPINGTACHFSQLVIYEAANFIEEAYDPLAKQTSSTDDNNHSVELGKQAKAMAFLRALRSTKLLERPGYIKIANETQEQDSVRLQTKNFNSDA